MYDPPAFVWAIAIAGPAATAAATVVALYRGAERAGLGRRRAALLVKAAAVLHGGWFAATMLIAGRGWYDTGRGQVPWLPVAMAAYRGPAGVSPGQVRWPRRPGAGVRRQRR